MEQGSVSRRNLFKIYGKRVIVYHSTDSLECPFCTILRKTAIQKRTCTRFNFIAVYVFPVKRTSD